MPRRSNKKPSSRRERQVGGGVGSSGGIAGYHQTTLTDVPADFVFDELRDMSAYAAAVTDIVSFELYDPKEEGFPRSTSSSRPTTTTTNNNTDNDNHPPCRLLAQGGDCYHQRRVFNGGLMSIRTQITRVDSQYDQDNNSKSFVTVCSSGDLYLYATTTWVVEKLLTPPPPPTTTTPAHAGKDALSSSDASSSVTTASCSSSSHVDGAGCRLTMSYALLPDTLYGKIMFCLARQRLEREIHALHQTEFRQVHAAIRDRYYLQQNKPSSSSSCLTTTTTTIQDPVAA